MMRQLLAGFAAATMLASAPLAADDGVPSVSAKDPEGMLSALTNVGYPAELGVDTVGDPQITVSVNEYTVGILFYGCDAESNDNCDSVQLLTGFDRAEPIPHELALQISQTLRFAAVQIDDEGDPFIGWDIFMGNGIPMPVFLAALRSYESTLDDASTIIFAEENEAE